MTSLDSWNAFCLDHKKRPRSVSLPFLVKGSGFCFPFFSPEVAKHIVLTQKCHILMSSVTLFRKGPVNADLHKVKNASSKQWQLILWSFRGKYCAINDGTQSFNFIADKSNVIVCYSKSFLVNESQVIRTQVLNSWVITLALLYINASVNSSCAQVPPPLTICKFCAAQGPGICQPRGSSQAFDGQTWTWLMHNFIHLFMWQLSHFILF